MTCLIAVNICWPSVVKYLTDSVRWLSMLAEKNSHSWHSVRYHGRHGEHRLCAYQIAGCFVPCVGHVWCIQLIVFTARCIASRGTSHGPVSVCLSVTSRSSTKTAKRRITQTTPHDSPGTLVFWNQRSPRNSTGVTPYEGAECRWGGSKSATFD